MADSACTVHGGKVNGKLFFAYVNYYEDDVLVKRRLRMCSECVVAGFDPLIDGADEYTTHGQWRPKEDSVLWHAPDASLAVTAAALSVELPSSIQQATSPDSV